MLGQAPYEDFRTKQGIAEYARRVREFVPSATDTHNSGFWYPMSFIRERAYFHPDSGLWVPRLLEVWSNYPGGSILDGNLREAQEYLKRRTQRQIELAILKYVGQLQCPVHNEWILPELVEAAKEDITINLR